MNIIIYWQIKLEVHDTGDYHRVFWQKALSDDVTAYRLTTAIYGTSSAHSVSRNNQGWCLVRVSGSKRNYSPIDTLENEIVHILKWDGFELAR